MKRPVESAGEHADNEHQLRGSYATRSSIDDEAIQHHHVTDVPAQPHDNPVPTHPPETDDLIQPEAGM